MLKALKKSKNMILTVLPGFFQVRELNVGGRSQRCPLQYHAGRQTAVDQTIGSLEDGDGQGPAAPSTSCVGEGVVLMI